MPVVEYVTVTREAPGIVEACERAALPDVRQAGQSGVVGGDFEGARSPRELEAAIALAAQYDRKVIVERAIVGRELECAVLGNDAPMASLPCEILPSRDFYDYDDKYLLDRAETKVPADLAAGTDRRAAAPGRGVLQSRGVRGHGRAWISCSKAPPGKLYINEINTIPGSRRSACTPRCGSTAASRSRRWWTS